MSHMSLDLTGADEMGTQPGSEGGAASAAAGAGLDGDTEQFLQPYMSRKLPPEQVYEALVKAKKNGTAGWWKVRASLGEKIVFIRANLASREASEVDVLASLFD